MINLKERLDYFKSKGIEHTKDDAVFSAYQYLLMTYETVPDLEKRPGTKKAIEYYIGLIEDYLSEHDARAQTFTFNTYTSAITIKNYFDIVTDEIVRALPPRLQHGHHFLINSTNGGQDLDKYYNNNRIRLALVTYLDDLNEFIDGANQKTDGLNAPPKNKTQNKNVQGKTRRKPERSPQIIQHYGTESQNERDHKERIVERHSTGLIIIQKYLAFDGRKDVSKSELRSLINYIRRALLTKKISRSTVQDGEWDTISKAILQIQSDLIQKYNSAAKEFKISTQQKTKFKGILRRETLRESVKLLKTYIGFCGKQVPSGYLRQFKSERASPLLDKILGLLIVEDVKKRHHQPLDPYYTELKEAAAALEKFVGSDMRVLPLAKAELHGFGQLLNGLAEKNEFEELMGIASDFDEGEEFDLDGID